MNRFATLILFFALTAPVRAADHVDAPGTQNDPATDLTDVFIFRGDPGKLIGAICFGGQPAPRPLITSAYFDPDVIYLYNIDTDGDTRKPEFEIQVRFGRNGKNESGIEIENLPGANARYVFGPVDQVVTGANGLRFYAALRDDPFFFDVQGFNATLRSFEGPGADRKNGTLMFDPNRDSFGRRNLTAIVFEMNQATVTAGQKDPLIRVWVTTGRLLK